VVVNLLINATKHINMIINDESNVANNIIFTHTYNANTDLVDSHLDYHSNIEPTFGTINWGLYYKTVSQDGSFYTNRFNDNVVSNSQFPNNNTQGWVSETGITGTASSGIVAITSTTDWNKFKLMKYEFCRLYGNQFILEFEYETSNSDAYIEIDNTDGTSYLSPIPLQYNLPISSGSFTKVKKIFYLSSFYPHLQISLIPRTNGGTGNLQVKNLKLLSPNATDKLGSIDKQLM
jgi:hypothetical protein